MENQNSSYSVQIGKTTFIVCVKQSETAKKPIEKIDNICTFCAKALFLELCVYYKTLAGKLHPRTC